MKFRVGDQSCCLPAMFAFCCHPSSSGAAEVPNSFRTDVPSVFSSAAWCFGNRRKVPLFEWILWGFIATMGCFTTRTCGNLWFPGKLCSTAFFSDFRFRGPSQEQNLRYLRMGYPD